MGRKKKKKRVKLIQLHCKRCKHKWRSKKIDSTCPKCGVEEYWKKKKEEAQPIPEEKYEIFQERLVELRGEKEADRNLTLFLLGVATGYRLGDLVPLTIANILDSIEEGEFCIQESKQYKSWENREKKKAIKRLEGKEVKSEKRPDPRIVEIGPNLEKILRRYCRNKRRSEYAFISSKYAPEHIEAKSFSKILRKVSEDPQLDLKNISGHSLRKTYATRLYEDNGGDVEFVRRALGHRSITTTQLYLGLDKVAKKKATSIADKKL